MESQHLIFTKNWNVYQKIIRHNYMFHQELETAVGELLQQHFATTPLQVLDLGCGDAALISKVLTNHDLQLYVGIDTSATVLTYAAQSFAHAPGLIELLNDGMEEAIADETRTFNFIHSSYAIHHLTLAEQTQLLAAIYDRLSSEGIFVWIDVFRLTNQPRADYLAQYLHRMKTQWAEIEAEEFALLEAHITQYDFPNELETMKTIALQKGFTVSELPLPDNIHHILVFQKK